MPVWLATGALILVAAIIAPHAIENTSWAYILPYMTILAIAALGQMLVIMHAGIDLSKPVVTSCGSGITAAVITLALETLGHTDNRLYDGSWTEWGARTDLPIETGTS